MLGNNPDEIDRCHRELWPVTERWLAADTDPRSAIDVLLLAANAIAGARGIDLGEVLRACREAADLTAEVRELRDRGHL